MKIFSPMKTSTQPPKISAFSLSRAPNFLPIRQPQTQKAQVVTPILSGVVMDAAPTMLFGYITLMGALMLASVFAARHGDTILIDEVARREEAYNQK